MDESHSGLGRTDDAEPVKYVIPSAPGPIVDPGVYEFPFRADFGGKAPDSIVLIVEKNRKYKVHWQGPPNKSVLDASTLEPLPGSEAFRGFKSGDTLMIAIGLDKLKENAIGTMWLGLIEVQ